MNPHPMRFSSRLKAKVAASSSSRHPGSEDTPVIKRSSTTAVFSRKKQKRHHLSASHLSDDHQLQAGTAAGVKVKGKRGKLRVVTEMPLDVLFEVFGHLQPVDLLNLSRASKTLRAILLSRSASTVWTTTFLYVNPPPPSCPSDLNIVQYANLLYGRWCYLCSAANASSVVWPSRLRSCKKCLDKKFVQCRYGNDTAALKLCSLGYSTSNVNWQTPRICLRSEYKDVCARLKRLAPGSDKYNDYVDKRKVIVERNKLDEERFHRWVLLAKQSHEQDIRGIREGRKKAILTKIREIGLGEELDKLSTYQIENLPGLKLPKELTNRAWEMLRPSVVKFMGICKEERLKQERRVAIGGRYRYLSTIFHDFHDVTTGKPSSTIFCLAVDYATMEPFRSLIFDTPADQQVAWEDFKANQSRLSDLAIEWKKERVVLLLGLLPETEGQEQDDEKRLTLATTFFSCGWCREPITYPRILAHSCLRVSHSPNRSTNETEDEEDTTEFGDLGYRFVPWSYNQDEISFDEEASNSAKAIVTACGMDPDSVLAEQMDMLEARVECLRCAHPSRGRLVMTWTAAILHHLDKHYDEETSLEIAWRRIDDDDIAKVAAQETKSFKSKGANRWRWPSYQCLHCRNLIPSTLRKSHLSRCHLQDPLLNVNDNFVLPLDTPMKQPPYAVRI